MKSTFREIKVQARRLHVIHTFMQEYLAHKKTHPSRILPYAYAKGPTVVLRGGHFLMSEVPLYTEQL